MNKTKKSLLIATLAAALGMGVMSAASADEYHGAPQHQQVKVGWHGDRYWDGHRYWERKEWEHHHAHHDAPPPHHEY